MEEPLRGKRILVPPARPEANPLLRMLEKRGAEVAAFPELRAAEPEDIGPMEEAILQMESFDWIIFSGSNCVSNFLSRMAHPKPGRSLPDGVRIAAIGYGAVSVLKKARIEPDYVPEIHTAEGVIRSFPDPAGKRILLVRVAGASRFLPDRLREMGTKVTEVEGYRMIVETDEHMRETVFGAPFHALALANPTSIRFLRQGAAQLCLDLPLALGWALIAAVGPATAEAASSAGLKPDVVSGGHIRNLVETLVEVLTRTNGIGKNGAR